MTIGVTDFMVFRRQPSFSQIFALRTTARPLGIAPRELRVRKISLGECGHAHKAMIVIADRILTGDLNIPRESILPLLEEIVLSGRIEFDPSRNNFPVTLHDPCNMVRLMGIVAPQRRILKNICPQFREMMPHGVENYCCGGGSGFAITQSTNFPDWRSAVSGRMKMKQIIEAFQDVPGPEVKKYVCAPCSNCKEQFRDMFESYGGLGEVGDPLRRARGAHRQRDGRPKATLHPVGVALTAMSNLGLSLIGFVILLTLPIGASAAGW